MQPSKRYTWKRNIGKEFAKLAGTTEGLDESNPSEKHGISTVHGDPLEKITLNCFQLNYESLIS